ncbi:hypothetical protein LINBF2_02590 [Limnohabitans sp. INBF002]|nr:hypothetical protein LINBF2_02590 [Limnohabitans sp. INBF002]
MICSHVLDLLLYESLDSCFVQSYSDFEMIFVCNGDLSEKIAQNLLVKYANEDRLTIVTSNLKYLTHSLNLGLDLCRAELVARMDADDRCVQDRLKIQMEYMNQHPEVCVLGSYFRIIDKSGLIKEIIRLPYTDSGIRKALFWRNPICHPSVIYRKNEICKVGGYMGGLQSEDYDLWIRLAQNNLLKFAAIEEPLLLYRSMSSSDARKSKYAYAAMASAQLRLFVVTLNLKWLLGAGATIIKRLLWVRKKQMN